MKIRELLYCNLDPTEVPNTTSPVVAPVAAMPNGMSGPTQTTGPTTVSGAPSSQGGTQMAQAGPVPMMPNTLAARSAQAGAAADSIATGPFGSKTPLPTASGSYYSDMIGRPPIPLR